MVHKDEVELNLKSRNTNNQGVSLEREVRYFRLNKYGMWWYSMLQEHFCGFGCVNL